MSSDSQMSNRTRKTDVLRISQCVDLYKRCTISMIHTLKSSQNNIFDFRGKQYITQENLFKIQNPKYDNRNSGFKI